MDRTNTLAVVAAALLTVAGVGAAVGLGAPAVALSASADADAPANANASTGANAPPSPLVASASPVALQNSLADLTGLIDRVDAILESVVDLLRTLNELFRLVGAGEAEG